MREPQAPELSACPKWTVIKTQVCYRRRCSLASCHHPFSSLIAFGFKYSSLDFFFSLNKFWRSFCCYLSLLLQGFRSNPGSFTCSASSLPPALSSTLGCNLGLYPSVPCYLVNKVPLCHPVWPCIYDTPVPTYGMLSL